MRIPVFLLAAILLVSCGGFTQRKYLERNAHAHIPRSTQVTAQPVVTDRTAAQFSGVPLLAPAPVQLLSSPADTLPADTAVQKNVFDRFRAKDDADRARRAVKSGLLSAAASLVYYAAGYATLKSGTDISGGQAIVVVFLVLIPLCFLIGMLAVAFGIFAMYRGFRVKKNNKGEEHYAGKSGSTAGILLGIFGVLLAITATILLRQL